MAPPGPKKRVGRLALTSFVQNATALVPKDLQQTHYTVGIHRTEVSGGYACPVFGSGIPLIPLISNNRLQTPHVEPGIQRLEASQGYAYTFPLDASQLPSAHQTFWMHKVWEQRGVQRTEFSQGYASIFQGPAIQLQDPPAGELYDQPAQWQEQAHVQPRFFRAAVLPSAAPPTPQTNKSVINTSVQVQWSGISGGSTYVYGGRDLFIQKTPTSVRVSTLPQDPTPSIYQPWLEGGAAYIPTAQYPPLGPADIARPQDVAPYAPSPQVWGGHARYLDPTPERQGIPILPQDQTQYPASIQGNAPYLPNIVPNIILSNPLIGGYPQDQTQPPPLVYGTPFIASAQKPAFIVPVFTRPQDQTQYQGYVEKKALYIPNVNLNQYIKRPIISTLPQPLNADQMSTRGNYGTPIIPTASPPGAFTLIMTTLPQDATQYAANMMTDAMYLPSGLGMRVFIGIGSASLGVGMQTFISGH